MAVDIGYQKVILKNKSDESVLNGLDYIVYVGWGVVA